VKINQSLIIQQPVDNVFECLSDFSLSALWSGMRMTSEPLNPAKSEPHVGYCYKNQIKLLNWQWEVTYEIIEFEPNHLFTAKTTTGWLPGIVTYCLEPQERATRLMYRHEFELVTFFKPVETVLQKSLERQAETDLANLKDWLESGLYTQVLR
jgi:uncharacterized protein YndB with AHSA1/START domain